MEWRCKFHFDFFTPRSDLVRFFLSLICLRDFCTASARPFCSHEEQVSSTEFDPNSNVCPTIRLRGCVVAEGSRIPRPSNACRNQPRS